MCAVSAVSDHYMNPKLNYFPQQPIVPIQQADPEIKEALRKVVEMLDKIDQKLGERDCQDEHKAAFFKAIGYVGDPQ